MSAPKETAPTLTLTLAHVRTLREMMNWAEIAEGLFGDTARVEVSAINETITATGDFASAIEAIGCLAGAALTGIAEQSKRA